MSPEQARALLAELGFQPGDSTADHPRRTEIKAALNALRDDAARNPAVPPPPALGPVKRPRRTEDAPPRDRKAKE